MSKLYTRDYLIFNVKKVDYERDGRKLTFNKIETVLKGKKYNVKMSQEVAQKYALDRLQPGNSYKVLKPIYNYDSTTVYRVIWLKQIDACEEFDFNSIQPELDED